MVVVAAAACSLAVACSVVAAAVFAAVDVSCVADADTVAVVVASSFHLVAAVEDDRDLEVCMVLMGVHHLYVGLIAVEPRG